MGVQVRIDWNESVELEVRSARRLGLLDAAETTLAVSDLLAPHEPEPRHDVHMIETGFARLDTATGGGEIDVAVIGYDAFWAIFQHEDLTYHHPHGGEAKFLEHAVLRAPGAVEEHVAARLRTVLG